MFQDPEGGARASATEGVQLGGVFVPKVGNATINDGAQIVEVVNDNQVLEGAWGEEEGVTLFQGHRRSELWLVVVVAQVSYLVQVAGEGGVVVWRLWCEGCGGKMM